MIEVAITNKTLTGWNTNCLTFQSQPLTCMYALVGHIIEYAVNYYFSNDSIHLYEGKFIF